MIKSEEARELVKKFDEEKLKKHNEEVEQYCKEVVDSVITNCAKEGRTSVVLINCPVNIIHDVSEAISKNGFSVNRTNNNSISVSW